MPEDSARSAALAGLGVVLIGRFVGSRRGELVRRLKLAGARVGREVTPAVQLVVVGNGPWPVRKNGRMPRGLLVARILHVRQSSPELIDETVLRRRYPELGAIAPTVTPLSGHEPAAETIPYQDWQRARVLAQLLTNGVSPRRLQRALCQLGHWFPQARTDWERLSPTWDGGRLLFRTPQGLVQANGQRVFDDAVETEPAPLTLPLRTEAVDDPFAFAVDHELRGDFPAAERAYRKLLLDEGPDADVCFNLANVLVAMNQRRAALERLWQCVELAPRFSEAWHNLGTVALELRETDTAVEAFQRALALAPHFRAAQLGLHAAQRMNEP